MKELVGIKFRKPGKIYFFDPGNLKLELGQAVIAETQDGEEYATVAISNKKMQNISYQKNLKKIIRIATKNDKKQNIENKKREQEAYKIALKKIKEHNLDMKLLSVEYKFNRSKLMFYFTASNRIDFRSLVKDLAAIFKTRIELRQLGARDEVKRLGTLGVCGQVACCVRFKKNFEPINIKMAKDQDLSLNPTKLAGLCGRLMCCLSYEQNVYEDKLKELPKIGTIVKTEDGEGTVENLETLKEKVRVKIIKDDGGYIFKSYEVKDVKIIKEGQAKEKTEEEKANEKELERLENMPDDSEECEDI